MRRAVTCQVSKPMPNDKKAGGSATFDPPYTNNPAEEGVMKTRRGFMASLVLAGIFVLGLNPLFAGPSPWPQSKGSSVGLMIPTMK